MARRAYSNIAVATTLSGTIASDALSLIAASATGYPASGAFTIRVDKDLATEEIILIASRSGATFTIDAAGRGYDGTTPAAHTSGATIELVAIAADYEDANAHRWATPAAAADSDTATGIHHTLGATGDISTQAMGDAAAAGASNKAAGAAHKHGMPTFVATPSTQAPGDAASGGAAATVPRGDHKHAMSGFAGTGIANTFSALQTFEGAALAARAATSDEAFIASLTTDTVRRWGVFADGKMEWGPGGVTARDVNLYRSAADTLKTDDMIMASAKGANLVVFQDDDNHSWEVDGSGGWRFRNAWATGSGFKWLADPGSGAEQVLRLTRDSGGKLLFGSAEDTNLYRGGANLLKTDDDFEVGATLTTFPGTASQTRITSAEGGPAVDLGAGMIDFAERGNPAAAAANHAKLYARDNGAGKTQLVAIFASGAVQVIATQP